MVRMTYWLCRVPVIKFKKGGLVQNSAPPAASAAAAVSPGSCPARPRPTTDESPSEKKIAPIMLGIVKLPKEVFITGHRGKEGLSLNIILQKQAVMKKKI